MSDKHKYRVTVYLGKEVYEKLKAMADYLGLPMATATRLLLNTGIEFSKALENQIQLAPLKQPDEEEQQENGKQ